MNEGETVVEDVVSADDTQSQDAAPVAMPVAAPRNLRATAEKSARTLWSLTVVLATLGGVLGLLQFIKDSTSGSRTAEQAMVIRLIEDNDLSSRSAAELLAIIEHGEVPESEGGVFDEGSDRQAEALSLLRNPVTFSDGLDMFESAAVSASDWDIVAQHAVYRDNARAESAIRKAIALEPDKTTHFHMLATAQMKQRKIEDAARTLAIYETLAASPRERLLHGATFLELSREIGDMEGVREARDAFRDAVGAYRRDNGVTIAAEDPIPLQAIEDHPLWLAFYTQRKLAEASHEVGDWYAALNEVEVAIALSNKVAARGEGRVLESNRRHLTKLLTLRAEALRQLGDPEQALPEYGDALAMRYETAKGSPHALVALSSDYRSHALALHHAGYAAEAGEAVTLAAQHGREASEQPGYTFEGLIALRASEGLGARLVRDTEGSDRADTAIINALRRSLRRSGVDKAHVAQVQQLIEDRLYESALHAQAGEGKREAPLRLHGEVLSLIAQAERRYGASETTQLLRARSLYLLASDHAAIGAEDEARETMKDTVSAFEDTVELETMDSFNFLAAIGTLLEEDEDARRYAAMGLDRIQRLRDGGFRHVILDTYATRFRSALSDDDDEDDAEE